MQSYLERLAQIESGGNPLAKNPNSSAKGLYQFIDSTAQQYGINAPFGTPEYTSQETEAVKRFTEDNRRALLRALGREPTADELYLAHQQGAGGAIKLLSNPQAPASQIVGESAVSLNAGKPNMTAEEFTNLWRSKFGNIEGEQSQDVMFGGQGDDNIGTFNLELPDGTILEGIPEGTTKAQIRERLSAQGYDLNLLEAPQEASQAQIEPIEQTGQESSELDKFTAMFTGLPAKAVEGFSLGLAPKIAAGAGALPAKGVLELAEMFGAPEAPSVSDLYKTGVNQFRGVGELAEKEYPKSSIAAELGGAIVGGAKLAGTRGAKALANLAGRGGLAGRVGAGALAGESAQRVYEAGQADVGDEAEILGRKGISLGGVLGGSLPVVGAGLRKLAPRVEESLQPLIQKAQDLDIPVRLEQAIPSKIGRTVQKVSQAIPASGTDAFEDLQRKNFTRAVARTMGLETADLGPESVKAFKKANRNSFESALAGKTVSVNKADLVDIGGIKSQIDDVLGITDRDAKILAKEIDGLLEDFKAGELTAKKFSNIRSNILEKSTRAGKGSVIFENILSKMDDMAESVGDVEMLKQARRHYRNFKTVEPLITESTDGIINPTKLLQRLRSSKYIDVASKAIGEDDLVDLGRIGKLLVKQGGSDTFEKSALTGQALTGLFGLGTVGPLPTAIAATTAIGANRALQKGLQSQGLLRYANRSRNSLPALANQTPLRVGTQTGAGLAAYQN